MRLVELQPLVRKIDEQLFQPHVALFGLAEVATIETDVAENAATVLAAQLLAVGEFEIGQRDVDQLADIGLVASFVEVIERTVFGHLKPLTAHGPLRPLRIAVVALEILPEFRFAHVADVFQEKHREDIIFVLAGVDDASESVAGFPHHFVDVVLGDFTVHLCMFWSVCNR